MNTANIESASPLGAARPGRNKRPPLLGADACTGLARMLAEYTRPVALGAMMEDMALADGDRHRLLYLLQRAREAGLVQMVGNARNTRWTASSAQRAQVLREQLAAPLNYRPRVGYEELFLGEYVPNQSFYLSGAQRERLHSRCAPGSAQFNLLSAHDQSLFLCGLSFASSSLEGSRYDLAATERLLLEGLEQDGATPTETTMVLNHHEAVRFMVDNTRFPPRPNDVTISLRDLKSIHGLLSADLLRDPMMCGRLRRSPVFIKHSAYTPLAVGDAIEAAAISIVDKALLIDDPYEQSFFLLAHLPYLQPFEDCNKRTARVSCNIPLLRSGVLPMSWMDISQEDFVEAILGVYERCNPTLLAEVFTEGYLRSAERFEVMARACEVDPVRSLYRSSIRATVRSIVLDGPVTTPEEVELQHRDRFAALVQTELTLLKKGNPATLVQLRLGQEDVNRWIRSLPGAPDGQSCGFDTDAQDDNGASARAHRRERLN